MRASYDFSQATKNPFAKKVKKSVTIRLEEGTLVYFKALAEKAELPYQTLINLYLKDCAQSQKQLRIKWESLR
jgi:predicted DNA binding CopG/RHH family protein